MELDLRGHGLRSGDRVHLAGGRWATAQPPRWTTSPPCAHCGRAEACWSVIPEQPQLAAPQHVDLFCGLGGFRMATDSLGFHTHVANDICPGAQALYQANEGASRATFVSHSLRNLCWWPQAACVGIELVTGGFPCQPLSTAGSARGTKSPDGDLGLWAAAFIEFVAPAAALLEHVPGILAEDKRPAFDEVVARLKGAGYLVT